MTDLELKNILKDEYGIEPAAGGAVMMAGAVAGTGSAEGSSGGDEKTEFNVILKAAGDKKINVIKNGNHSLSNKRGLKIILKELKLLV